MQPDEHNMQVGLHKRMQIFLVITTRSQVGLYILHNKEHKDTKTFC